MYRALICLVTIFLAGTSLCRGQVSGNVNYAQPGGRARGEQVERNKRVLTKDELPPTGTSMFIEANVMMNVKADESESIGTFNRQTHTTQSARKSRTFFFNSLDAGGFDQVINPVVVEPVVQFTLYLKVKYEIEQTKAK